MEATLFSGWIYDTLKPYAARLEMAHPAGCPSLFSPCEWCRVPHPLRLERAQHAWACGQSQRVGDSCSRILTGSFSSYQ